MALNWLGDSLDGTLARVRKQQRPKYGFYVDHIVDVVGAVALMGGPCVFAIVHWQVAMAMLVAFLVLSSESFLATYTLGSFEMSQGWFGPTELRILLAAANVAAAAHVRTPLCWDIVGCCLILVEPSAWWNECDGIGDDRAAHARSCIDRSRWREPDDALAAVQCGGARWGCVCNSRR